MVVSIVGGVFYGASMAKRRGRERAYLARDAQVAIDQQVAVALPDTMGVAVHEVTDY